MSEQGLLNSEAVVAELLKQDTDVVAIAGTRIVSQTPSTTENPWVRVTLIDPQNRTRINRVERLVGYYLQIDCYAGNGDGQADAFALAKAVRNALVTAPDREVDGVVVTDAEPLSMPRIPDTDFAPARQRYILDLILTMHPKP